MTDSSSTILVPSWVAATVAVVAFSTILGSTAFGGTAVDAPPAVTYAADIAPIIARECLSCHTPDGSAPFSLLTYEDVRSRAERIAESVEQGSMPPWLPESEPGTFQGERRLTAEEVDLLRQWADEQAPAGDLTAIVTYEGEPEWDPGPPDLIVKLPAYTVPAEGREVFRNLVVPIPVTRTRWVESVELRPGSGTVHHARMMLDTTASSRDLADQDENPGFDPMHRSAARTPNGHFLAWTPGRTRVPPLEGMAWRLDPGTDMVVKLHLRPSGSEEEVTAEVVFYFGDEPPIYEPVIIDLFYLMIDIPAGAADYTVTNRFELPVDVDVLGVYPHAHYLGKDMRGTAILPDGREVTLIHIPNWDFNWQREYRFVEPISLPAGTTILQVFSFDNTEANPNNPSSPPRRVVFGANSTDEMADLILQVLPRNPADRPQLVSAVSTWDSIAVAAYSRDQIFPAERKFVQGQTMLEEGDLDAATSLFQEALRYRPDHIQALIGLSRVFAAKGDAESALLVARQGVTRSNREDPHALDALAKALAVLGQLDEALRAAQEALPLAWRPEDVSLADSLEVRIERYRGGGRP